MDNALYRLGDDMVVRFPRIRLEWDEYGQASGIVAVIDPPHRFAFRWRVHGVAREEPLGRTVSWMAAVTENGIDVSRLYTTTWRPKRKINV